jgi:hypothetical protein
VIDDPSEVAIELGAERAAREASKRRKASRQDLRHVVLEDDVRRACDLRLRTGEEACHPHTRRHASFGQGEGSHPQLHDAARARMCLRCLRRRRAGEEESSRTGVLVNGAAYRIPHRRKALPFVDQHGRVGGEEPVDVGPGDLELSIIVQIVGASGAAPGGRGLPDPLRSLQRDRGELRHQLVELRVDDARPVAVQRLDAPAHRPHAPPGRVPTLPIVTVRRYQMALKDV